MDVETTQFRITPHVEKQRFKITCPTDIGRYVVSSEKPQNGSRCDVCEKTVGGGTNECRLGITPIALNAPSIPKLVSLGEAQHTRKRYKRHQDLHR